jgi:Protein HRI1
MATPAQASIHKRLNIRWIPSPFHESTSTLILSSPSGLFVDLRIKLHTPRPIDGATGLPAHAGTGAASSAAEPAYHVEDEEEASALKELEWAVAGQAAYAPDEESGKTRGTWTHWISYIPGLAPYIDFDGGEAVEDTGLNTVLPDGTTREEGAMVNPDTGLITAYEETWASVPVTNPAPLFRSERPRPGGAFSQIQSPSLASPASMARKRVSGTYLVAKLDSPSAQGLIIWVGQSMQGFAKHTSPSSRQRTVVAERWHFYAQPGNQLEIHPGTRTGTETGTHETQSGRYARVFRHGDGLLPCGMLLQEALGPLSIGSVLSLPHLSSSAGADSGDDSNDASGDLGEKQDWQVIETDFEYAPSTEQH